MSRVCGVLRLRVPALVRHASKKPVVLPPTSADLVSHDAYLRKYYDSSLLELVKYAEMAVDPLHYHNRKTNPSKLLMLLQYYDNLDKRDWVHDADKDFDPATGKALPKSTRKAEEKLRPLARQRTANIAKGLSEMTGFLEEYIAKLTVRPLLVKRVLNQTAFGKIASFYAMVCVGDQKGMVGLGEGKLRESPAVALKQAHWLAVRNMVKVGRYEDRTIIGNIQHKFHAVKIFLRSAPAGFGLRVNHLVYEICQCAGIKDLGGKVYQLRNKMNLCKGVVEALASQKLLEELAVARGKKVVDLRKAFYAE